MKRLLLFLLALSLILCLSANARTINVVVGQGAAAGGASYTDSFTDDANPLPSPWVTGPTGNGIKKLGGVAVAIAPGGNSADTYYNQTFNANQYSQAVMKTWGGAEYSSPGVSIRNTGTDFYYTYINYNATRIYVQRFNAGTAVVIGACSQYYTQATSADDVLRMEASGTTITVKLNSTTICTCTDSTLSTGRPGIYFYGVNATLDDWAGGDL